MLKNLSSLKTLLPQLAAGKVPSGVRVESQETLSSKETEQYTQDFQGQFDHYTQLDGSKLDTNPRKNSIHISHTSHHDSESSITVEKKIHLHEQADGSSKEVNLAQSVRSKGPKDGLPRLNVNEISKLEITDDKITQFVLSSTSFNSISGELTTIDRTGQTPSTMTWFIAE